MVSVSILIGLIFAEGAARILDQLPLTQIELPVRLVNIGNDTTAERLDDVPRAPSVERAWFFTDPPPLPNRKPVPAPLKELDRTLERANNPFRSNDVMKVWNSVLVGDPCTTTFIAIAPGAISVVDPVDGKPQPPIRGMADTTTPVGLVTTELGWRGAPIPFARTPKTIRIVFAGASTTSDTHQMPYSYPEFIGHWLNLWAAKNRPDLGFEVANAARESIASGGIEAIVRTEVVPTRPDLVIYHEGGNQFSLASLVEAMPAGEKPAALKPREPPGPAWLTTLARYSDIARRIQTLLAVEELPSKGLEAPKPDYKITWPKDVSETDPDIAHTDLPVNLTTVLGNLDRIRADLAPVDAELAVTSFLWMVKDGLKLDPIRNRMTWDYLNLFMFPYRYRDLERLAIFQNVVLKKYARERGIDFIDIAGKMPFDPDLYADGVHTTYPGTRMKGWVILQQLVPLIEARLASGAWPKTLPAMDPAMPPAMDDVPAVFKTPPRRIEVNCQPQTPQERRAGMLSTGR